MDGMQVIGVSKVSGLQGLAITMIEHARSNIRHARERKVSNLNIGQKSYLDAFWLLCDARETWMPIAYNGRHTQFYKIIRSEVFKSKGFASLMKIICDPDNPDGEVLSQELDRFEIWS